MKLIQYAAHELVKAPNLIKTAGTFCGCQRIRSKKLPKEERVLRDVAPKYLSVEGTLRQSLDERVLQARIREIRVLPPKQVVKHSGLPSHAPEISLVVENFVEVLLLLGMEMLRAQFEQAADVRHELIVGPSFDELCVRTLPVQRAPGNQVRSLHGIQDCDQDAERLGVG